MNNAESFLWKEKISKLLFKFSIPCVISFIVNALYNIVDQVFIWRGINYLANWATNIVFPLTMICLWFWILYWDGAASWLSLKLWEKKKEEAAKGVATGILMSIITSIIFCWITLIFLPDLLNLFWCTDALRDYAITYGRIIAIWIPFFMLWITFNSIIRADGNPKFSMMSMIAGAIINTLLDPLFIFTFDLGIAWAAYATVISQIITFGLNTRYITKLKTITLTKDLFTVNFHYIWKIVALWISSLINQISIVAVIAVTNNLLAKYGSTSKFWSEIPITVIWIVMKIAMILNSIILWIAVGSQPIIGYNYWAKNYSRVKETLKLVLTFCSAIWILAFILFQTIPEIIISIFGTWDALYTEFAIQTFKIYLFFCFFYWIQIPSWIFFQAIWKSKISAILSLSRQILILIPAFFILGSIYGINWILYAGAVADLLAFLLAVFFLTREIRHLWRKSKSVEKKEELKPLERINSISNELFETIKHRSLLSND